MTAPNNQPAPEGFLRLSSKWLETHSLPEDGIYYSPSLNKWEQSTFRGRNCTWNDFTYATARTDLPREAYAADEIRPMTHEERKALDEFTMKELTESEPAPDLTQAELPKADLTQRGAEEASERAEAKAIRERVAFLTAHRACHSVEHDPANGKLHGYCVICGVPFPCDFAKPQEESTTTTLRAQLEAKEAECRELRGIVHQLDRRDALAGFKTVGDKISALLKIAAAADPKAELTKSITENDKLRAEVEELQKSVESMRTCGISGIEAEREKEITRLTADLDAVRKERDAEVHQTEAFIRALGHGWSGTKTIEDRQEFLKAIHQSYLRWIEWKEEAQARCGALERASRDVMQYVSLLMATCVTYAEQAGQRGRSDIKNRTYADLEKVNASVRELKTLLTPSQQPDNLDSSSTEGRAERVANRRGVTMPERGSSENQSSPAVTPPRPEPVKAGELDDLKAFLADAITAQIAEARRWEDHYKTDPDGKIDRGFWEGKARAYEECLSLITDAIAPEGKATEGGGWMSDEYEYLGDLSATPPWHSRHMSCDKCRVSWTGCWDNFQCPKCGEGELPTEYLSNLLKTP